MPRWPCVNSDTSSSMRSSALSSGLPWPLERCKSASDDAGTPQVSTLCPRHRATTRKPNLASPIRKASIRSWKAWRALTPALSGSLGQKVRHTAAPRDPASGCSSYQQTLARCGESLRAFCCFWRVKTSLTTWSPARGMLHGLYHRVIACESPVRAVRPPHMDQQPSVDGYSTRPWDDRTMPESGSST